MPLVRTGAQDRKIKLRGNVWDHADLLCSVARASLRSFTPGPWGDGDTELAYEMIRRCRSKPCDRQCFVVAHANGAIEKDGCTCGAALWQYTSDEDAMKLEGREPQDVWSDARAMLDHHTEIGLGPDDPIHVDCDDLAEILAACAVFEAWVAAGCPFKDGLPIEGPNAPAVYTTITQPPQTSTAHAFVESSNILIPDEPTIRSDGLFVTDPAARWAMGRPPSSYYGTGSVARFRLRLSDLVPPR